MNLRILSAPGHSVARRCVLIAGTAMLALGTPAAFAQQPTPIAPAAPQKAAPKAKAPAKQQPAQTQPAPQQPAAPNGPQAAQPQPQDQQLPVVYSPWTKFCGKDQQPGAKETCLTIKEARLETGQFVAGAALIEQEGQDKKILRITLPLGMQLPQGTRLIIDKDAPVAGRYVACLPNGCMADFEVNAEFVGKLKKGQQMVLQGINLPGQQASYPLPLADFAKANEGPPTDPKEFEAQQKKLQDELQRRAEEARKKLLERQQQTTPPAGQPKQ